MPRAGDHTLGIFGIRSNRPSDTMPQTDQAPLFTVHNGRVAILGVLGLVTVVMGATASNLNLLSNPASGAADSAMCAVLASANLAVDTQLGITGIPGDAMIAALGTAPMCTRPIVVPAGTIDLNASGSNTGEASWALWWVPLDAGARVSVVAV